MGRHATGDPDDSGDDSGDAGAFTWEEIPDEPAPDDPRRRRRVRALVMACVLGAALIAVVTVVAVRFAFHDVAHLNGPQRIHDRYAMAYKSCIAGASSPARSPARCAERVFAQCADDAGWGSQPDPSLVLEHCGFGPRP